MLTKLTIKNFKRFRDETPIELGPITVLLGANNSGKSTVLQALSIFQYCMDVTRKKKNGGSCWRTGRLDRMNSALCPWRHRRICGRMGGPRERSASKRSSIPARRSALRSNSRTTGLASRRPSPGRRASCWREPRFGMFRFIRGWRCARNSCWLQRERSGYGSCNTAR